LIPAAKFVFAEVGRGMMLPSQLAPNFRTDYLSDEDGHQSQRMNPWTFQLENV
jgi:hypothetical protein